MTGAAFGASKVAAELSGTGQVVETTTIGGGQYQLPLPASPNGTLYDLVASGPGFAYAFAHNVLVRRGKVQTVQLDAAPAGQIALTGKVTDACSGMPLQGATVEVVAPVAGSTSDCTQVPTPSDCVVLASANTDDTGTYPMPPSNFVLQSFSSVPNGKYTMVVTDAGYDTVASSMSVNGGAACSLGTGGLCNFALGRSTIEGLVTDQSAGSQSAGAQCAGHRRRPRHPSDRECRAGHGADRIECGAVHDVRARPGQRGLARHVRDGQRLLQRIAGKGERPHHRGVERARAGLAMRNRAPPHPILSMQCAGHGSIMGSTTPFDDGTSIVLSKNGVQLMSTGVGPRGGTAPGQFSLCAPADPAPYQLQRFEAIPPAAEPTPVGTPIPELMAPPLQVAQPCNSICGTGSGQCLVCVNNAGVTVP